MTMAMIMIMILVMTMTMIMIITMIMYHLYLRIFHVSDPCMFRSLVAWSGFEYLVLRISRLVWF